MIAKTKQRTREAVSFVKDGMWEIDVDRLSGLRRLSLQVGRFIFVTTRGYVGHRCSLHAAGLTYFSILSVLPALLLMLLLTKPCGMYDWAREKLRVQTDQMIETFFEAKTEKAPVADTRPSAAAHPTAAAFERQRSGEAFADQARELRDRILGQIDDKINNFNFGLAAIIGFGVFAWTVVSTVGQVESAFNEIWNVRRNRSILREAYLYTGTLMVLPLLAALAMYLPVLRLVKSALDVTLGATSYTRWAGDAMAALFDSSLFSYAVSFVSTALAMSFIFRAMPNRRVQLRAALKGGVVTTALLSVWLRLCSLVQFGIAETSATYGSFALIPILIVWIFMSWKIVLLGCNMTYAFQCVHSRVRDLPCE